MAMADIAVFTTIQADSNDSDKQQVIKDYLEQAYSQTPHEVNVMTPSNHPNPPTEKKGESFSDAPCSHQGQQETSYDGLLQWWRDYHACHNVTDAKDGNILVTDANAPGGVSDGHMTIAHGRQVKEIDPGEMYNRGCTSGLEAVGTVLHEAGHCVGLKHQGGYGYEDSYDPAEYYMTPVLKGYAEKYDNGDNLCGDYIENYDESYHKKCKEMYYSDCNVNTYMSIE